MNHRLTNRPADTCSIVDDVVDAAYLDLCEQTMSHTTVLAREVLRRLGPTTSADSSDRDRQYRLDWLRRAASRPSAVLQPRDRSATAADDTATIDLLRHVADAYPRILDGTATGNAVLFTGRAMELWAEYFASTNELYRPVNAAAAAAVLPLLDSPGPLRVLEVGAGTGGATTGLLTAWPDRSVHGHRFTVTDASGGILLGTRRRVRELTPPGVEVDFRILDVDTVAAQDLVPGSIDVILGVNCLHNATDLPRAVRDLHTLLRPGGTLMLGESLCSPGDIVHQEFVFNILPLHPEMHRRRSRFLSTSTWREVFVAAGLTARIEVNSRGPELVMVAAVTAQSGGPDGR